MEISTKMNTRKPYSDFTRSMLTDMYQLTMAYAYWRTGRHNDLATFEVFFRKNPFKGEYTIFAGLSEVLRYLKAFSFSKDDIDYLRSVFPTHTDPRFWEYLQGVDSSQVKIYAIKEGSVCFPRIPIIRVEGPLAITQLFESAILNLTNYPSLVATNARRMRIAAGEDKVLFEFGLRRAQGPDGAVSASCYSYVGGFDGTSNCLAGKLFGIAVRGTNSHAFVSSFNGTEDLGNDTSLDGKEFMQPVLDMRDKLGFFSTKLSELVAFVAYAQAFPDSFLVLVDTFDTVASGLLNFICVALVLREFGHQALGIRLDSGDLAYLSRECRKIINSHGLEKCIVMASNDINEEVLLSLADQGHCIDSFGIGTNLVTCEAQPALGMVYKLVEINGRPCIKLSDDFSKTTIPGKKSVYRLFGSNKLALCDLICRPFESPPQASHKILCTAPFEERKRCHIIPSAVEDLHNMVFDGDIVGELPNVDEVRNFVNSQCDILREDHIRALNPTRYKVSMTEQLRIFVSNMWNDSAPVRVLS